MSVDLKDRPSSESEDGSPQKKRKSILADVPIALIWPNPDNPRSFFDPADIQALVDNMKLHGQRTAVKLVRLTEEEIRDLKAKDPGFSYEYKLLGGHRRLSAAKLLGWDTLQALILDLTPDEAELEAALDNRMTELHWLDQYRVIERQKLSHPKMTQEEIGKRLEVDQASVSRALKTLKYLNQGSREVIYAVCIKSGAGLDGGKMVALALSALEDEEMVEKALKVALHRKMTESQAKKLVQWVKAGNQPEDYDPKAKTAQIEKPHSQVQALHQPVRIHDLISQKGKEVLEKLKNPPKSAMIPEAGGPAVSGVLNAEGSPKTTPEKSHKAAGPSRGLKRVLIPVLNLLGVIGLALFKVIKWFGKALWHTYFKHVHHYCKFLANQVVPISSHSSSSHRNGLGPLARNPIGFAIHWTIYLFFSALFYIVSLGIVGFFIPSLKPWISATSGYLFHLLLVQMPLWLLFQALHTTWLAVALGIGLLWLIKKILDPGPVILILLAVLLVVAYHFKGNWEGYIPQPTPMISAQPSPQPVPQTVVASPDVQTKPQPSRASVANAGSPKEPAQSKHRSGRVAQTQMPQVVNNAPSKVSEVMAIPWRSEDEDRSTLEDEIAVIPQPAFIKPLAIQPDQSISPDMVIHRLADITDGEKYTVFVGHEQKKIQNVVPSTSGLALVLEGGMLGLSGAQKAELYWEDVKAIHCSELITQKKGNLYQCSLLISASKKPMTFQCSTESDCAHLVSALEYWLRPTHGGKDVPITGMPYLTQGLRTMDNITVATIWADSPADKAGLKLGDIVWSLDTNPDSWVGKDSMERELQALSYGRHILYAVPAADWAKAKDEQLRDPSATFNPTRKGLVIKVSEGKPGQN